MRAKSYHAGSRVIDRDYHDSKRVQLSSTPKRLGNASSQSSGSGRGRMDRAQKRQMNANEEYDIIKRFNCCWN